MSLTCHSSFGPAAGHCLSRPVSVDTPVRCGPRHWGQSEDELRWAEVLTGTAERHTHSVARVASSRNFKIFSFGWLGLLFVSFQQGKLRIAVRKCFVAFRV